MCFPYIGLASLQCLVYIPYILPGTQTTAVVASTRFSVRCPEHSRLIYVARKTQQHEALFSTDTRVRIVIVVLRVQYNSSSI